MDGLLEQILWDNGKKFDYSSSIYPNSFQSTDDLNDLKIISKIEYTIHSVGVWGARNSAHKLVLVRYFNDDNNFKLFRLL